MKIKCLLILNLLIIVFSQKKNDKKQEKKDPKSNKPGHMSDELFCVGCVALAIETVKILKGKKNENDVFHALANVCKGEYNTYC